MYRFALLFTLILALCSTQSFAQASTNQSPEASNTQRRVVDLITAIDLASRNNLELLSKGTAIDTAAAREQQAKAGMFPKISTTTILSPVYAVEGNPLRSTNDLSNWGAWLQSTVTILQPVYAFGKLSSFQEA